MAGPHSAAALSLIMQRFPYMTNSQAMYTMFTTGRQNDRITNASGQAITNPTRGQIVQVPDTMNGWGTVSLREAMRGPGQLFGPTNINTQGYSDVWSNDVSDVAIQARQADDAAEATAWAAKKQAKGWTNGIPADASDQDKFDYATGVRREAARDARIYSGSLIKDGDGTLFLTGNDGWHGTTTVNAGKLSIVGTLSNVVDVSGGTLGGSGTVGGVNVAGTLAPGLAPDEAARITDVTVSPGNELNVAGDANIAGHLAITARSATDYTSLNATGDLVLNGPLDLDVEAPLTPGTALTIAKGRSVTGTFAGLAQGSLLKAGGVTFLVSYLNNAVTLIVASTADGSAGGTVPATLALTLGGPATFGALTPGVAKDYTASTSANVITTAGDATLSVSDPGHLMNGTFALPSPLVVEFSKSTWTGPASNDPVTITFKQHVGATDALRTGSYSKTLTFTLSTTTP